MSATATLPSTPARSVRPATLAAGAGIGIGLALVGNLAIFALGSIGAPLEVVMAGETAATDLPVGAVVGASILPILVGALGLWVFERVLAHGFRAWAITAVVLAVVSVAAPIGLDVDTESKVALAAMHLVVGAAAVAGQAIARRKEAA